MFRKPDSGGFLTENEHFSQNVPPVLLIFIAFLFCIQYLSFPNTRPSEISKKLWDENEYFGNTKLGNLTEKALDKLSKEFQNRIRETQEQGCEGHTLLCGHFDFCGLGCQIHHRVACLMISVSLNIPLIHNNDHWPYKPYEAWDEISYPFGLWPYKEPWNKIFYPLGSNCSVNNLTLTWDWRSDKRDKRITFDLLKGLPIPKSIEDRLKYLHPEPFLWVVGQFMKYALRPSKYSKTKLEKWSEEIGLRDWTNGKTTEKIVGFNVRRTDKIREAKDSYHELPEYVGKAEPYFSEIEERVGGRLPRRVLLFSDDNNALYEAQKLYPSWDIRGFNSTMGHTAYLRWQHGPGSVMEIFRAIFLLSECDYVICGFSSNLCRLFLEVMSFKYNDNPKARIGSLDGSYTYFPYDGDIPGLIPYNETKSSA